VSVKGKESIKGTLAESVSACAETNSIKMNIKNGNKKKRRN
jgi:hypothetical protein